MTFLTWLLVFVALLIGLILGARFAAILWPFFVRIWQKVTPWIKRGEAAALAEANRVRGQK
jgi:hypothetical protein